MQIVYWALYNQRGGNLFVFDVLLRIEFMEFLCFVCNDVGIFLSNVARMVKTYFLHNKPEQFSIRYFFITGKEFYNT